MFYPVLFHLLLWRLGRLSLQNIMRIVHCRHLNGRLIKLLFTRLPWTFHIQRLLVTNIKTWCFRCEINRWLVIVLVHFRNVERNQLCGWTTLILYETGLVQILTWLRHLPLRYLVLVWLHLLHVLWKRHTLFEVNSCISFKIIVHIMLIKYIRIYIAKAG